MNHILGVRTDHLIALASALRFHALEYLTTELKAAGIRDLIPSHGAVLSMLYGRGGSATMKELVEASGRGKSTLTEMVNALERRGYVTRSRDQADARGVQLELTDKGRSLRPLFDDISRRLLATAWGDLAQEDRESAARLLEAIVSNLAGQRRGARKERP